MAHIDLEIRNIIAEISEPLYCLLYGREKDNSTWIQTVRFVFSFLVGILMAYLLWLLMAVSFNFGLLYADVVPQVAVFAVLLLFGGITFALSRNVRAVTLLIFVGLVGNTGRSYLRAVAFAFVIWGPIDNLVTNAGEVARVFACTTVLTYNLTKTRFDLIAKPFTNTQQQMKGDIAEIQDIFKELESQLADLKYVVEQVDIEDDKFGSYKYRRSAANTTGFAEYIALISKLPKASEIHEKFVRNMRNRCKHQLRSGHHVCQEVFRDGYRKCTTNFPIWLATDVCWPYRIGILCKDNMFGNPDKVCNASRVVPANFGVKYHRFLQAEQELFWNSSNVEISYELQNTTPDQMRSAKNTAKEFLKDFERRRRIFHMIMKIIQTFLYLFIVLIIWSSISYLWQYRDNVEFDNYYVTDYFKHIDARLKDLNKASILPLKRYEKSKVVDLDEMNSRTVDETRCQMYHLLQLALEMVIVSICIFIDRVVVDVLRMIQKRSLIAYHEEGDHQIRFRINGTGIMARLLRITMKNFNIHEQIETSLTNEECLPVPHSLPLSFYIKLLILYLTIIYLIYYSTSLMRLRPAICSYFFYKREKQRILFLYNSMLHSREFSQDALSRSVEHNMAERHVQGRANIFLILRLTYPDKLNWLGYFTCAKRRCLICSTLETKTFVVCPNCGLPYCRECCKEMARGCIYCLELRIEDMEDFMPSENASVPTSVPTSVDLFAFRKEK